MEKLKQLSKQLLSAKKSAQEPFLKSILSTEVNCWSDFYKYVKRRKGNRENIPAIKDNNGLIITDPTEKANLLNLYYSTVFSSEGNIPQIQGENTDDPFTIDIKTIRIGVIRKNKSVGPDRVSGEILKLVGEAMIPYLARLVDITMNNGTGPGDWKRATVLPVQKGVTDY
jgi:hypothetical protein